MAAWSAAWPYPPAERCICWLYLSVKRGTGRSTGTVSFLEVLVPAGFDSILAMRGQGPVRVPVLWQNAVVLQTLTERKEWKFFSVLPKADLGLAAAWWMALLLRGILPAAFAIAMGVLVGAVQRGDPLAVPLAFAGAIFMLLQVLSPIHQAVSANHGDRRSEEHTSELQSPCNLVCRLLLEKKK